LNLSTALQRSTSKHRIVVELDIGIPNEQWVNNGAGIWCVDFRNTYPWVDASLLDGFAAQDTRPIGSLKIDGVPATEGVSVADLADTPGAWYYEGDIRRLWVTCPDFDEPSLHTIIVGQIYSYSHRRFTPANGPVPVEGRLLNTPSIEESRDPLFYGRLSFPAISVQLANGDGEFDTFGTDVDIYGNDVRVFVGFEDVDYSEYLRVFTGFMQSITVGEEQVTISVSDKRRQLTRPITYSCTDTNALTAIEEIITQAYGYTYDSTFYDMTEWAAAKALVANITIDMQEPAPVIDVIADICGSVFGVFRVNADNLFTFKVVDASDPIQATILAGDIMSKHSIAYDSSEVASSVRVGYAKNWGDGTYTYYTDASREADVFAQYKTYSQKTFDTLLVDEAAAIAFAKRVLDYTEDVHGTEVITVPIENRAIQLGDQIKITIQRGNQPMIGDLKAEVISVERVMDTSLMNLGIRHMAGFTDIAISDVLGVGDSADPALALSITASDTVGLDDTVGASVGYAIDASDTVSLGDESETELRIPSDVFVCMDSSMVPPGITAGSSATIYTNGGNSDCFAYSEDTSPDAQGTGESTPTVTLASTSLSTGAVAHTNVVDYRTFSSYGWCVNEYSHDHDASHGHSKSMDIYPPYVKIACYESAGYFPTGALVFAREAITHDCLSLNEDYDGKYVLVCNSAAEAGETASGHLSTSISTENNTGNDRGTNPRQDSYKRSAYFYGHYHKFTHSHALTVDPPYRVYRVYNVTSPIYDINSFPSGTMLIGKGASSLSSHGWSKAASGYLLKIEDDASNEANHAGNATIQVSNAAASNTSSTVTNTQYEYESGSERRRIEYGTQHSIAAHGHTCSTSSLPKTRKLVFWEKD